MSASSSDSWILIALTILVVLLLFYLSKKMICNSYGSTDGDSPTTSPSSSTSISFSDYGQSPLEPDTSTPETDDLATDIADSLEYHQYWIGSRGGGGGGSGGCNNNTNNLNLSNSVTSNGISRRVDVSGSPPSLQPILYPISIIGGPELDRKTMLEAQLRNQIVKIVQAEREIQRLTHLLAIEQAYISAARATSTSSYTPTTQPHPSINLPPNTTTVNSSNIVSSSEDDHHNSQGNHQQNESLPVVPAFSDFLWNSNSTAYSRQLPTSHCCRCNLCRRVLRLSSTANNRAGVRDGGASDFLTRSDLHYQQQQRQQEQQQLPLLSPQPVPDSQSSHYHLPSQHNHQQQQNHHQVLLEDNPPAYEECIRSSSYNWEGKQL
ncbi:unnamed protein product [Orchesella dallaii]|uniref:Uncharacterized protein n=1 Tax=Orchesella dallaii TaxID=48710 RepID=A0ABP1QDJ9_9HEXA